MGQSLETVGFALPSSLQKLVRQWQERNCPSSVPQSIQEAARRAIPELKRLLEPASPERVRAMLAGLALVLPSHRHGQVSDAEAAIRLRLYLDGLADVPAIAMERACRKIVRNDHWFPTIARIREVAAAEVAMERMTLAALIDIERLPVTTPDAEPVDAEQFRRLLARLSDRTRASSTTYSTTANESG